MNSHPGTIAVARYFSPELCGETSVALSGPYEELVALIDALPSYADSDSHPLRGPTGGRAIIWSAVSGTRMAELLTWLRRAADDAQVDLCISPRVLAEAS
jgi:hypothetical protein